MSPRRPRTLLQEFRPVDAPLALLGCAVFLVLLPFAVLISVGGDILYGLRGIDRIP